MSGERIETAGTGWTPTDEQVSAAADALVQYETSGMCHPGQQCQMCDCGMQDADRAELAEDLRRTLDRARYVLAAVGPAIAAEAEARGAVRALREAGDDFDDPDYPDATRHLEYGDVGAWLLARAEQTGDGLTAALAEACEARDIAQGQWRWYQARAERAEAALAEVAALADEHAEHGQVADASGDPEWTLLVRAANLRAILARTEQTGADR